MHRQPRVVLFVALLVLISSSISAMRPVSGAVRNVTIGIDASHSNFHVSQGELLSLKGALSEGGIQLAYAEAGLNQSFLARVDMLIISSPTTPLSPSELADLGGWFAAGGRLWISASSDASPSTSILNTVLRRVNSTLGFEAGYTSDPIFNLNSKSPDANEVLLPIINHSAGLASRLSSNLRILYAYQPIPIVSFNGSSYIKYSVSIARSTTWVAETTDSASVVNSSSIPLLAYTTGEKAQFPVAVVEESGSARLAVTGAPFFSQWQHEFEYNQNQPYDNRLLVKNILQRLSSYEIPEELENHAPRLTGTGEPQIAIYTGSGTQHHSQDELQPLISLLNDMGFTTTQFQNITSAAITNAAAIIIQAPVTVFTPIEANIIDQWLQQKNKLLLIASAADYGLSGATVSNSLNTLLEDLNSTLRFEPGAVYDTEVSMPGYPYGGLTSLINHESPAVQNLTVNVRSFAMQFGTILAEGNSTKDVNCCYHPLENQTYLASLTGVTWIAGTSNASTILNLNSIYPLLTHGDGQKGSYIVAAQEKYRNSSSNSKLMLLGGPIFSNYNSLLRYPTLYGYPVDNILFVRNIFASLLSGPQTKTSLSVAAFPSRVSVGQSSTLAIRYYALEISASDVTVVNTTLIAPANVTLTLSGNALTPTLLANQTYSATSTLTVPGSISWSVSAAAKAYQPQMSSGFIQVDTLPSSFGPYVLAIPAVIFIIVTIVVIVRKTR